MKGEETNEMKHFLGFLGLCRRAGKIVCGTPLVCLALQKTPKPPLVLYASGSSAATKKKIESKCAFYGVTVRELPISPADLAAALGKGSNLAAVAITDPGFADAMQKKLATMKDS
ncbi:MAG: ribosomal L7Ae/L30e/S12e/Gadd45 family protein [Clostridia bacterium]|nr:ribosomal L7Ae/L30e/S12e/Gadd45 family protein [Clostridia bacterium]